MYKKGIIFVFITIFLASCGVRKPSVSSSIGKTSGSQQEIINYGMKYLNTPYRYSGRTPKGFDCSGFTSFIFKEFGYNLSGSSSGQDKQTPDIDNKMDLRTGDLVFFEGRAHNGKVGHVGIVKDLLSDGEFTFLHASTSNGVIVSRSTEPYYSSRYLRGGRILKENNQVAIAQKSKKETSQKPIKKEDRRKGAYQQAGIGENIMVTPPKTETELEIETLHAQNPELAVTRSKAENKTVIHSRPSYLPPANSQTPSRDSTKTSPKTTKDVRRSENTEIPKPKRQDAQSKYHTVKPSETLYSISQKYGCTMDNLREWNPGLGSVLKAGDRLEIRK